MAKPTWNKNVVNASARDMNSREIAQREPFVANPPPTVKGRKTPMFPMPKPKTRKVNRKND